MLDGEDTDPTLFLFPSAYNVLPTLPHLAKSAVFQTAAPGWGRHGLGVWCW